MYNRSLFERDEGGRIEMQPCTVEIFDRCQLMSAFTADFSCFPAVFSLFSAVVSWFSLTGTFAVGAAASSNNWLDLVLFFKTFFFTYMYVLTENLIVTSSVSVFGQAVFWHENKSSVARSVFLFSFAFSIVLSFRQESEFLHGFFNNVLVALE